MVKHLGIVGAGLMGTSIAQLAAVSKIQVTLYDINDTILRRSIELIKSNLRKAVNLGKLTNEDYLSIMDRIRTRTNLPDIGNCDLIIESVIEDIRIKKDLIKRLDLNTKSSTVLASTTESLSISSIASLARYPERVIGAHFFNPVESSQIVELIKGIRCNPETIQTAKEFIKTLNKTPLLVKDMPGFISTRLMNCYLNESLQITAENIASVEQIDRILKEIGGFQTGAFELMDNLGIDHVCNTSQTLFELSGNDSRFKPNPLLKKMSEAGLLGKKSDKGFYDYKDTNKK